MKYRTLGRTRIKVSAYALRAMMIGAVGNPDHDDSICIIPYEEPGIMRTAERRRRQRRCAA